MTLTTTMKKTIVLLLLAMLVLVTPVLAVAEVCHECVTNGDFETGDATGWTATAGDEDATVNASAKNSGSWGANITAISTNTSILSQSVDLTNVDTLTFYYKAWGADKANLTLNFSVNGDVTTLVNTTATFTLASIDVSGYTGANTILFSKMGDGAGGLMVDDVGAQSCAPLMSSSGISNAIVAALSITGVSILIAGLAGIFISLQGISGIGGSRNATGFSNVGLLVASIVAVMLGSVLLVISYMVIGALFTLF